jgi:hypothetical protein
MRRPRPSRLLPVLGISFALAVGTAALADAPRPSAETLLKEVEASPRKAACSELIVRARASLDRAAKLRASGDEPRAQLAEDVAKTWAEAARDVLRAIEVEERVAATRRAATDAGVQAERERALLEETVAQSGRLRAQLEGLERERKEEPARTSTTASDAGAPKAKPPAKKPAADGGAS